MKKVTWNDEADPMQCNAIDIRNIGKVNSLNHVLWKNRTLSSGKATPRGSI
jgi:hypothetical protein